GGEEFTVLFQGKSLNEVVAHLEMLRGAIENSSFSVRGGVERRSAARGADRRKATETRPRRAPRKTAARTSRAGAVTVTVSIGVAASKSEDVRWESVAEEADQALYRAKAGGRNRVDAGAAAPSRPTRRARGTGA